MQAALPALLASLALTRVEAGSLFGGSDVVEFVPATFNSTVLADPRVWIVAYYAEWCGHCIHYAPVFKRIAVELLKEQDRVRLGALNCAAHHEFCGTIGVHGFPTVRSYHVAGVKESWTPQGSDVPREEFHTERTFPEWVRKRLPPASSSSSPPSLPAAVVPPPPPPYTHPPPAVAVAPPAAAADAPLSTQAPSAPAVGVSVPPPPAAASTAAPGGSGAAATAAPTLAEVAGRQAAGAKAGGGQAVGTDSAALRLVDAEVALLYSLRQGAFLAATTSAGQPPRLQGTALAELHAWLEFLASALPTHKACQDVRALATVVAQAQDSTGGALYEDIWTNALDGQGVDSVPPQAGQEPGPYWRLCRTYTCGLWTLFHILSIAAAERGRAAGSRFLADRGADMPAPKQTLQRIRGFVPLFFGCQECASHFVQTFDSCGYDVCKLEPTDGKGTALWLWTMHRGVTKRVAAEGSLTGAAVAPVPELWPSRAQCSECWRGEGEDRWDSEAVYAFLKASYWQAEWSEGSQGSSGSPDFALVGGLLALAALGYFLWRSLAAGGLWDREKGS